MNEATLKALKGSIKHWEENASLPDGSPLSLGSRDCALCNRFYGARCHGCPVAEATGVTHCGNTPYYEIENGPADLHDRVVMCDAVRPLVQAELDFLRSLLPGGVRKSRPARMLLITT